MLYHAGNEQHLQDLVPTFDLWGKSQGGGRGAF